MSQNLQNHNHDPAHEALNLEIRNQIERLKKAQIDKKALLDEIDQIQRKVSFFLAVKKDVILHTLVFFSWMWVKSLGRTTSKRNRLKCPYIWTLYIDILVNTTCHSIEGIAIDDGDNNYVEEEVEEGYGDYNEDGHGMRWA